MAASALGGGLRRRVRARLHGSRGRRRGDALARRGARPRHRSDRRLRRAELHQSKQPVDRHGAIYIAKSLRFGSNAVKIKFMSKN